MNAAIIASRKVIIYTDGACEGNPGPGGWAAVLWYGNHVKEVTGADPATTNNRMELQAAIGALAVLKHACDIELFTDSVYLKTGISEWLPNWKQRGWITVQKKPVKNEDLWRQLDSLASQHKITWRWVKGHAGHVDNEKCDQLAVAEIAALRKRFSSQELDKLRAAFEAARLATAQRTLEML